jgi:transposase-like protein
LGGNLGKGSGDGTPNKRGRGTKKIPVVGMVERSGNVKAIVSKKHDLSSKTLSSLVRKHCDIKNTTIYTDEYSGYFGLKNFIEHQTINHKVWYVDGNCHTNSIESFWAILKRGIVGQYHKVSIDHLPQYIDEFYYRYNRRKEIREDVFNQTMQRALGVC